MSLSPDQPTPEKPKMSAEERRARQADWLITIRLRVSQFRRERMTRSLPAAPAPAWVIRNGWLDPEWAAVDRRTIGIAGWATTAMIAASGINDVIRIYNAAERDGVDFNLAYIGRDFAVEYDKPFEQSYMRPLFKYGRQRAPRGDAWVKRPPS